MADDTHRKSAGRVFRAGPDGVEVDDGPDADLDARAASREALREMTFSTHLISLNAMALMHLGEVEGVAEAERDLEAAQHVIDTLAILAQKTRGNLTPEEERLLGAILYDLRMKFLRHTGGR